MKFIDKIYGKNWSVLLFFLLTSDFCRIYLDQTGMYEIKKHLYWCDKKNNPTHTHINLWKHSWNSFRIASSCLVAFYWISSTSWNVGSFKWDLIFIVENFTIGEIRGIWWLMDIENVVLCQKLLHKPWSLSEPLWCAETTTLYSFLPSIAINYESEREC